MQCVGSVYRSCGCLAVPLMLVIDVPRSLFCMASEEFTVSVELQKFMDDHGIRSVSELLVIDDERLLGMDGFGWRLMKEVLGLRRNCNA